MTDEQREALREQLKELADAVSRIESAMKPFDDAMCAVLGVRDALLERHEADVAGTCEHCSRLLLVGELGHSEEDGILCESCAPTWADVKRHYDECSEQELADMFGALEVARRSIEAVNAHIAAGDGHKKVVVPL